MLGETEEPDKLEATENFKEEIEIEEGTTKIEDDLEVKNIRLMTKKAEVQDHVLEHYGLEVDTSKTLKDLKAYAESLRVNRLFEDVE